MDTKDSFSGSKKGQVTEKVGNKLTNYYVLLEGNIMM